MSTEGICGPSAGSSWSSCSSSGQVYWGQAGSLSQGRPWGKVGTPTQALPSPLQADVEPILTSGASEVVPRVLSREPQSLCACSLRQPGVRGVGSTGRGGSCHAPQVCGEDGLGALESRWASRAAAVPSSDGRARASAALASSDQHGLPGPLSLSTWAHPLWGTELTKAWLLFWGGSG